MSDYRTQNDPNPNTTVHVDGRSGSSNTIYFILGGVVVLLGVLWLAFAGTPEVTGPADAPAAVSIENNAAPAAEPVAPAPAPEATITPDTPAPDAPEPAPAPEAAPAAPATPAPAP